MTVLSVILWVILAGFLLTAFCSTLIYWYETANSPCPEIPSPRLSVWAVLRGYVMALGGYFIGVGVQPIGWFRRNRHSPFVPEADLEKPPVVLVHGINDNAGVWLYLGRKLEKAGYRVSTFSYWSIGVSEEKILNNFDSHLHLVEASYPGQKPILIGHSLGGIFIRRLLAKPENQSRVLGVLTLATPHKGSKMAVLAPGAVARSLRPGSAALKALEEAQALEIPCTSLASPTDEAVLPAENLLPPKGWKFRVTHPLSHFGILFCPRAAKMLLEELENLREAAAIKQAADGI